MRLTATRPPVILSCHACHVTPAHRRTSHPETAKLTTTTSPNRRQESLKPPASLLRRTSQACDHPRCRKHTRISGTRPPAKPSCARIRCSSPPVCRSRSTRPSNPKALPTISNPRRPPHRVACAGVAARVKPCALRDPCIASRPPNSRPTASPVERPRTIAT